MNQDLLKRFAAAIGWKSGTPLTPDQAAKLKLEIEYDDLIEHETTPKVWDETDF